MEGKMSLIEITQLLGNLGEFVGAIAVVITLVFLTVQIRTSNTMQRAQTHQQIADARNGNLKLLLQYPELNDAVIKVHSGAELSEKEEGLLRQFTVIIARHHENELYQHSQGMVDDDEMDSQREIMLLPHIRLDEVMRSIHLYSPRMREEISLLQKDRSD